MGGMGGISVFVDNRMNSVAMIEDGRNRDKERGKVAVGGGGREKRRQGGKEKLKGREKE